MMKAALTIFLTGLIAGTLDILAAIFILAGGNASGTFKYIASGAFGSAAFAGGGGMIAAGAAFHYFIALFWTFLYFVLYPRLAFLRYNPFLSAALYGAFVWTIMTRVVVPLTQVNARPFNLANAALNAVILMFCIGLPAALSASRFYGRNPARPPGFESES